MGPSRPIIPPGMTGLGFFESHPVGRLDHEDRLTRRVGVRRRDERPDSVAHADAPRGPR